MEPYHGTTILSVRRQTPQCVQVAICGDGQVTLGNIVVKGTARKVRKSNNGNHQDFRAYEGRPKI